MANIKEKARLTEDKNPYQRGYDPEHYDVYEAFNKGAEAQLSKAIPIIAKGKDAEIVKIMIIAEGLAPVIKSYSVWQSLRAKWGIE